MIIYIYICIRHFDLHLVVFLLVNVSVQTGMVHAISGYRLQCTIEVGLVTISGIIKWDPFLVEGIKFDANVWIWPVKMHCLGWQYIDL